MNDASQEKGEATGKLPSAVSELCRKAYALGFAAGWVNAIAEGAVAPRDLKKVPEAIDTINGRAQREAARAIP